jgi:hypothetical protein
MTIDKSRKFKIISIFILIIAVIGLSIAYAAMSEVLSITGTAKMNSANWNIKFNNLSVEKTGNATFVLPKLSDTSLLDYEVNLTTPGDSVTFIFDVSNNGNINATIGSLTINKLECIGTGDNKVDDERIVCNNITYNLKYSDGTEVRKGDFLERGSTKTMKLSLIYDSDSLELPNDDVTVKGLDINMIYNQD